MRPLIAAVAILVLGAAAPPPSVEAIWKDGIAGQNKAYAQTPHAMLKIQDSAYLGDGQTAVLQGQKGRPGSWRWSHDAKAQGALRVWVAGGRITVMQNRKPVDPVQLEKSVAIDADVDVVGHSTQVGPGIPGWRIFVYNQQNQAAKNFKGVSYYPYDATYRVTARFSPDPKLPPRVFRTSRGTDKQFFHAGDATFSLKEKTVTLPFYTDSHDPAKISDMSAFFTDDLTGKGAYGAGRYIDVDGFGKFPPSTVTIDFNQAYNPNCARSAHFTCPVAVDNIALAMRAGERDPHLIH
jgi:hypothetical protein